MVADWQTLVDIATRLKNAKIFVAEIKRFSNLA